MQLKKRKIFLIFGDFFSLYFALFFALFLRYFPNFHFEIFKAHLFPFSLLFFLWILIFYIFGIYDFLNIQKPFFSSLFICLFLNFFFSIFLFYFFPIFGISPKTNLFLVLLFFTIFSLFFRAIFFKVSKEFFQKVFVLGNTKEVENLKDFLSSNPQLGFKLAKEKKDCDILVYLSEKDPEFLKESFEFLEKGKTLVSFDEFFEQIFEKIPVKTLSEVWFLRNLKEGDKKFYDGLKRIFDIFLSLFVLIFTLPFWPLIALAIKIEDGGPVFFLQERVGKNKKIFKLIKFRSMIVGAEKEGPKWAEKEDERITKVGKFLRRFHLDEIPQMINILKGELSFVGPRPERPEFVEILEKEIPYYNLRHIIKPGFTGWAQIKFRYARSIQDSLEKFQYDLYYIKNRSLFLDLRILLKTFQLLFKKE